MNKRELGKYGEEKAIEYLEKGLRNHCQELQDWPG